MAHIILTAIMNQGSGWNICQGDTTTFHFKVVIGVMEVFMLS